MSTKTAFKMFVNGFQVQIHRKDQNLFVFNQAKLYNGFY